MRVFQASIEQMLWPERRRKDELFTRLNINGPGVGWIQRTTADSYIRVPKGFVPDHLRGLLGTGQRLFPLFFRNGEVEIGPIPKGTPVSLLTSMDLLGADLPEAEREAQRDKLLAPAQADQARAETRQRHLQQPQHHGDDALDEQVPGPGDQQGALLRDEPLHRGAGAERRRKARSDRVPEDHVDGGRASGGERH